MSYRVYHYSYCVFMQWRVAMANFQQTSWSLIFLASTEAPESRQALQRLCASYLPPVITFIRSRGYRENDAKDLAQEFFATLIEKEWIRDADRTRGKFRTFLLTSLTHFLSNIRTRQRAQKRGGGVPDLQLEDAGHIANGSMNPDAAYERKWALTVLQCAFDRLERDHRNNGAANRFDVLKSCLTPSQPGSSYREMADRLQISEGAAKVACHRLKKAYGLAIRAEIADTLPKDSDLDDELRYLMQTLGTSVRV